jgi:glycosyltransferase involved in cell wall biosynthesis
MSFSVLMSVYIKDDPSHFKISLDSIINQSLSPDEIVIVLDGAVSELIIKEIKLQQSFGINILVVKLNQNIGLGPALKIGLENCTNEIIARMDADDISIYNRFEIQYNMLINNFNLAVVGSIMNEFLFEPNDLNHYRSLPYDYKSVLKYSKYRSPLNHPTVMFRKSILLKVGSYENVPNFEDYFLWLKILKQGFYIENYNKPLLYFRMNKNFVLRRSGFIYLLDEVNFYFKVYDRKLLSFFTIIICIITKIPIRIMPKFITNIVYLNLLRSKTKT